MEDVTRNPVETSLLYNVVLEHPLKRNSVLFGEAHLKASLVGGMELLGCVFRSIGCEKSFFGHRDFMLSLPFRWQLLRAPAAYWNCQCREGGRMPNSSYAFV